MKNEHSVHRCIITVAMTLLRRWLSSKIALRNPGQLIQPPITSDGTLILFPKFKNHEAGRIDTKCNSLRVATCNPFEDHLSSIAGRTRAEQASGVLSWSVPIWGEGVKRNPRPTQDCRSPIPRRSLSRSNISLVCLVPPANVSLEEIMKT